MPFMRRREFLRLGASLVAGGYALAVDPGRLPARSSSSGRTLTIRGDVSLGEHTVPAGATLRFDPDADVTVEMTGNLIVRGTLEMQPQRGRSHTLRFVDIDERRFVGGGMAVVDTDVGLWVMGDGTLDVRGEPRSGWNRSGADETWRPRDEVLTTPFAPGDYTTFAPYDGKLASLTSPDGRVFTQEAFNLSRNVRIEGTPRGRTHIFIRSSAPQTIRYAAIRHVGPRQGELPDDNHPVTGRYGIHFHMCGSGSRGSDVRGTVVRDCGSHAFVPHMSHGITFSDCIAYNVNEDAFWWDGGATTDHTLWNHCMAARMVPIPSFRGYLLAGFNLGVGDGNELTDSVAVGNVGKNHASGFAWPATGSGPWRFEDCVAHNNGRTGLFIWRNGNTFSSIHHAAAFNNGVGIDHGAYRNAFQFERCLTFQNSRGLRIRATSSLAESGPLRWNDSNFFDGVAITTHTQESEAPAIVADSRCGAVLVLEEEGRAGQYDFLRTDLEPDDWDVVAMHPQSVYRVQRTDGTAYQVNPDGSTTVIAPFDRSVGDDIHQVS
jgi:hypothetical protein